MGITCTEVVAVLATADARRLHDALARTEGRGAIIGPDEETLFEFRDGGSKSDEAIDLRHMAAAFDGRLPPPEYLEHAGVRLGGRTLADLVARASWHRLTQVDRRPIWPTVDRVLAIPRGIAFLCGGALVRVPHAGLIRFRARWTEVLDAVGGRPKAISLVSHYLPTLGTAELEETLSHLDLGIAEAQRRTQDLLLASG